MTTPCIDHIGIIVTDLDQAIEKLQPLFGDPTQIKNLPEAGLHAAGFQAANVQIELLQHTDADADFARHVMGQHIGLNNVSARVADVERSIAELSAAGFAPMAGFPRRGAHERDAIFEPNAVTSRRFEVCQSDAPQRDGDADRQSAGPRFDPW